jgi:hypothetical protein
MTQWSLSTGEEPIQDSPVPENAGSPRDAEPGD